MAGENTAMDYSNKLDQSRIESPGNFRLPKGKADNYNSPEYADNYNDSDNHADRLAEARSKNPGSTGSTGSTMDNAKDLAKTAKNIAQVASPLGAVSLLSHVKPLADMPYVGALGAALLKDLLDSVAAPTVVLAILFSMLCSIFIFMMLLLAGSGDKKKFASKLIKKGGLLVAGGVADSIPGIDFFPIETLTVAVIYYLTLFERKNASKEGASDNCEQDEENGENGKENG